MLFFGIIITVIGIIFFIAIFTTSKKYIIPAIVCLGIGIILIKYDVTSPVEVKTQIIVTNKIGNTTFYKPMKVTIKTKQPKRPFVLSHSIVTTYKVEDYDGNKNGIDKIIIYNK